MYRREAWCLKEMVVLRRAERSKVRAMCGVQLKERKSSKDLMFMLGLNETIDQLAMAQFLLVWLCVEEREWLLLLARLINCQDVMFDE